MCEGDLAGVDEREEVTSDEGSELIVEIIDRAVSARDALDRKRLEHKLEDVRHENERLSVENRTLHEETRREQGQLERIMDALESISANGSKRPHRIRRTLTLMVAAGGAYVIGARAGRDRFDQIKAWWKRARPQSMRFDPGELETTSDTSGLSA